MHCQLGKSEVPEEMTAGCDYGLVCCFHADVALILVVH